MNTIVKNIIDCNGIKYLIKKTTKTKIFEDLYLHTILIFPGNQTFKPQYILLNF